MAQTDRMTEILDRVVRLVAEHGLAELTVEEDGLVVSVKGVPDTVPIPSVIPVQAPAILMPAAQAPAYSETVVAAPTTAPKASGGSRVALESPMVGVFYRSPSPDDPPFVHVGDVIRIGQTVGLIEAMKVYSELPSEVSGRIVEIAVDNGKLVKQGQPLFFVEPA